jgi:hypothetical protein
MLLANTNTKKDNSQQHVSSIRQLKTNYLLMKYNLLTFLIFAIAGCNHDTDPVADSIYHTWKVDSFMSVESVAYPRIEGNTITITFEKNGKYQTQLDENSCNGQFEAGANKQLQIEAGGCTKICCDSHFSEKFMTMLPLVTSYLIEDNFLKLNVPQWGWIELKLAD